MKISQAKFTEMHNFRSYSHTDLACEAPADARNISGAVFNDYRAGDFDISELTVSDESSARSCGVAQGRYITVYCNELTSPETLSQDTLSALICSLLKKITEGLVKDDAKILVAGLGNRSLTADSIGSRTADRVIATAHLNRSSKEFASLGIPSVSVISPGVSSQTGMETADIIKSAAKCANADIIIAIDALAAKGTERLCTTVQISDSGISPGSGIGNHRTAITKETMGVPVIAIGIPTVISCATLVYDSLEKAGTTEIDSSLADVLHRSRSLFVSHGESDTICDCAADILSSAINMAFTSGMFQS